MQGSGEIEDYDKAVKVAEDILFNTYGKESIIKQRPYEKYLMQGYWFIPLVVGVITAPLSIKIHRLPHSVYSNI